MALEKSKKLINESNTNPLDSEERQLQQVGFR